MLNTKWLEFLSLPMIPLSSSPYLAFLGVGFFHVSFPEIYSPNHWITVLSFLMPRLINYSTIDIMSQVLLYCEGLTCEL